MKRTKIAAAALAACLLVLGTGAPASADTRGGGAVNCTSGRVVYTYSTSGAGAVAHAQISSGVTWSKAWTNTQTQARTYSKALTSISGWGIDAQPTLTKYGAGCMS